MSEQQEHPEGTVAAQEPTQPTSEPEAPVTPPAEATPADTPIEGAPADATPSDASPADASPTEASVADVSPEAADATPAADASPEAADATPAADAAPAEAAPEGQRQRSRQRPVGPKIVGEARERTLPVVKKRLQEKPKREPLPWPELRAAVAATRDQLDLAELKELFRQFPEKLRDEVVENVRGFQKGARRPVSQHAAKQLARASHTARRMKKNAQPSGEVAEALGQAMAAELIASLEPEKAAQVILPKRDLLEREARQAQRRARDDEDRRRDEQRRRRREDAKSSRQQTSFGSFSGAKIKGLDEIAALFGTNEPEQAETPETPAQSVPEEREASAAAPAETPAPAEAAPPAQQVEESAEQRAVSETPAVPEAPPADAPTEGAAGAPAGENPS